MQESAMSILMYFSMNFNNYLQKFLSMFIFFRKIAAETPEFWKAPFPPHCPKPVARQPFAAFFEQMYSQ